MPVGERRARWKSKGRFRVVVRGAKGEIRAERSMCRIDDDESQWNQRTSVTGRGGEPGRVGRRRGRAREQR